MAKCLPTPHRATREQRNTVHTAAATCPVKAVMSVEVGKCFREQLTKSIIVCLPFGHSVSVITFIPTWRHSLPPKWDIQRPPFIYFICSESRVPGWCTVLSVRSRVVPHSPVTRYLFISHPVCRCDREKSKCNKNSYFEKGGMGNTL